MDEVDKKSKILLVALFAVIVGIVVFTQWKVMIQHNYVIAAQTECDPYLEKCFVHVCDPNNPAIDGECTGDPVEDTWYTKNMSRMAYNIPNCDPVTDEDCTAFVCAEEEKDCSYEFCNEANVPDGDTCNDPFEYTKNNPIEEEGAQCDSESEDGCDLEAESGDEAATTECDVTVDPDCEASGAVGDEPALPVETDPVKDASSIENPSDCNSPDSQSCSIPVIPSKTIQ